MINAMKFYDKKNLITCADDGKVCVIRTGTWKVEKTLLKHNLGVIDIAVHPSGKMALTTGNINFLFKISPVDGDHLMVS